MMFPVRKRRRKVRVTLYPSLQQLYQGFFFVLLLLLGSPTTTSGLLSTSRSTHTHHHRHQRISHPRQKNAPFDKEKLWSLIRKTPSFLFNADVEDDVDENDDVILRDYQWESRKVVLTNDDFPCRAEIYHEGHFQLVTLQQMEWSVDDEGVSALIPTFYVTSDHDDESSFRIDMGQITTIWNHHQEQGDDSSLSLWSIPQVESILNAWDQNIQYQLHGPSSKSRSRVIPKKELNAALQRHFLSQEQEQAFRSLAKTGRGAFRLMDSHQLAQQLLNDGSNKLDTVTPSQQQAVAHLLHTTPAIMDRFKRIPCQYWRTSGNQLTVINGGLLGLDPTMRAQQEARRVARSLSAQTKSTTTTGETPAGNTTDALTTSRSVTSTNTEAADRIVFRLEGLAMMSSRSRNDDDNMQLQPDLVAFLKERRLPLTPAGAREALVQLGAWSDGDETNQGNQQMQPFAPDVLEAAARYRDRATAYRQELHQQCRSGLLQSSRVVDLTKLPSLCIDNSRASFRDDAMGIRLRSSTGRSMKSDKGGDEQKNKWEVLVHITDVSDLYSHSNEQHQHVPKCFQSDIDSSDQYLELLQATASKRGSSRYDLPSGPLHLLPPTILQALSLETTKLLDDQSVDGINRCVTVWVYIDQASGKLLDAGVEQTLISCPIAMSFSQATDLLEQEKELSQRSSKRQEQVKVMLKVIEQQLNLWKDYRHGRDEAAKKRESRLTARELVDKEIHGVSGDSEGDRKGGFRRTRGHMVVDTCLDLYGLMVQGLLKRKKISVPFVSGTAGKGRVASAPLRRYVDGMAQRQVLAGLCGYGGTPFSRQECAAIGKQATAAINTINNLHFNKNGSNQNMRLSNRHKDQQTALRSFMLQVRDRGKRATFPAISTGRQSEVAITGTGVVATCRGIEGTLKPGVELSVRIRNVDEERGVVSVVAIR